MQPGCPASESTPRTSRSRRAACSPRSATPRPPASTPRCAPTTSPPGASARASPASPGRGWAPRSRPRSSRSAASTRPGSATTPRSSPRPRRRSPRCTPGASGSRSAPARRPTSTSRASRWPDKATRNARLRECVDIMRALFAGEVVDHDGLVTVDRARLWTLPAEPPQLIGAAVSEETAGWAGEWADGLVTINQPREQLERVLDAFREGGGEGKPVFLQVHLVVGGGRARGARHRLRPVAHQPLPAADPLGPPDGRGVRRGRALRAPRGRAQRGAASRPTSGSTSRGCRSSRRSGSTRSTSTTSARSSSRSSTPSGSTCSRSCDEGQGHQRPVVEERGRLLPRRRDVPGLRRRRLRRPRRA